MERLLVINAHPRVRSEKSLSLQVLEFFVSKYAAQNPASLIEQIDLYREYCCRISAIRPIIFPSSSDNGSPLSSFSHPFSRFVSMAGMNKGASKYVIAMPLHNFNIPSKLKDYMDNIIIPKETFRYTESGSEGLLTDGRSVVVIQGSDGIYTENDGYREIEYSHKYLKSMFEFLGITDYEIIRAQGRATLDVKNILYTSRLAAAEVVDRWSSE